MKVLITTTAFLAAGVLITAFTGKKDTAVNWGTKTLYQPDTTYNDHVPVGYTAVFVNYIGRHGARHVTGIEEITFLKRVADKAAQQNALTDKGMQLRKILANIQKIETKETSGLLTEKGKTEQEGIGRRLRKRYPQLFPAAAPVTVVTTKQKRTEQSAASFLQGLDNHKNLIIDWKKNDSISLRFYEIAPGYRAFVKKREWEQYSKRIDTTPEAKEMNARILARFFKTGFLDALAGTKDTLKDGKIIAVNNDELIDALHSITYISAAAAEEVTALGLQDEEVNAASLLPADELNWMEYKDAVTDYLVKGPGTDINGIQVRNAVPLLADIINTTDDVVNGRGRDNAVLRFAHAETVSPLASLLEVKGAAATANDIKSYDKIWHSSEIIPFSANIQWIVFKPSQAAKDYLIEILYNEKPVSIPVKTGTYPYYNWQDVKAFYSGKLAALHVNLNDDMYSYLQHIH